jgi:predicted permease
MVDSFIADLRYAARRLAAAPGFTLAAAMCVALGIGANTAIFSLADALLLRPLPGVTNPGALLEVGRSQDGAGSDTFAFPALRALSENSRTVDLAGWTFTPLALGGDAVPEGLMGLLVTDNYFDVLGVPMQLGRGFAPGESGTAGSASIIVISDRIWQTRYEADPGIIGRAVRVNGAVATVIGVTGPGFAGSVAVIRADAWVPFGMTGGGFRDEDDLTGWRNNLVLGVGRLHDGESLTTASEELGGLMSALAVEHPDALRGQGVVVQELGGLPADLTGPIQLFMLVMMAVVGVVLAVACVSVAGMLLARSLARSREVAVRLALGARRARLVRQLLTESILLVTLGGAVGVAGGFTATRLIRAVDLPIPPPFNVALNPTVDLRVLGFALLATAIAGVVAGLGPALRASRPDLVPALKSDASDDRSRLFGRRALIAAQVGMTVVLVVVAGLFLRALGQAGSIDVGFEPQGVYALGLDSDLTGLPPEAAGELLDRVVAASRALPGVDSAALAALLPLGLPSNMGLGGLVVSGHEPPPGEASFDASVNIVGDGYFDAMGIPLVAGRDFSRSELADGPRQAIVNAHMATTFWGAAAVGQTFTLGGTEYVVKGVAADSKYQQLSETTPFFIYVAHSQRFSPSPFLITRLDGDPAEALAAIRRSTATIAPDLPVLQVVALRSYAELGLLPQRVAAAVAGVMGVVVILLAAVGIYGVTAQITRRRVPEIGVRMALGADRGDVLRLVISQGMRAPVIGLVVGLAVALAVTRFLAIFLYGVSPLDPAVFAGGAVLLAAIAVMANWLPARWASRVDPVRALRAE